MDQQSRSTDVLVIGAGPAGTTAAAAAAGYGLDVLVLERKNDVGTPVQCAEYIPAAFIGELGCKNPSICAQKISAMQTFVEHSLERQTTAPGFIINRDAFDRLLADRAGMNGATILTSTRALGLKDATTVLARNAEFGLFEIEAKVIVAADGPLSAVRTWLNIPPSKSIPAVQMSYRLRTPSEFTKVFLSREIREGYGWLFPKRDIAHIGLGMNAVKSSDKTITEVLKKLVARLKNDGEISGEPLASTAGWIPVEPIARSVHGRVMFAGDAAGQTHPITGAGIFAAASCGAMAGIWAARAIDKMDYALLDNYEIEWREMFGRSLDLAVQKREKMASNWHSFDSIIKSCWIAFPEYHGCHG